MLAPCWSGYHRIETNIEYSRSVKEGLTWLAGACEAIDHVPTDAIIHTWVALTVIYVNLTVSSHVAWKEKVTAEFTHKFTA